ncbi:Holliday junction resolvase RuvX [Arcanobacterium phocisimile]|uniref:Putative pre-16S rRNA nuclease n=1 Tax=Arcanobacterium phocisimile TaxID=1302235 RepID=A0ABX7IJA5_9ACTO|nr:Holliday junction resolvase RuvX [Arcanobacterium phocisimile]QRV02935.1 Holliday junction resolvase RuvX [Arcanobacterium phocisimile]
MRQGIRIAVDVGEVRVGIARSDSDGILATPVGTYRRGIDDFSAVLQLIRAYDVLEVIVGLPRNMDGSEGKSATNARRWARRIAKKIAPISVRMVDERLSTVSAHQLLHDVGRKEKTHRSVIDQVAAGIILESALAHERSTGSPAGELIAIQEN